MRHFRKLAEGLPVNPLVEAICRKPHLWNQNTLRTAHENSPHREVDDILVWFNPIREDLSAVVNDLDVDPYPAWFEIPQVRPFVFDLMQRTGGVRLGRVLISRIPPGKRIYPHADGGAPATYYERHQVMLQCLPGATFQAGAEKVQFNTGDAFWFDNTQEHEVINASASDRLALIIDIRCA